MRLGGGGEGIRGASICLLQLESVAVDEPFPWALDQTSSFLILEGARKGNAKANRCFSLNFRGALARACCIRCFPLRMSFCSPLYHNFMVGAAVKETQQGNLKYQSAFDLCCCFITFLPLIPETCMVPGVDGCLR